MEEVWGLRSDGTIGSLIRVYRTDDESPYKALKHSSRIRDYEPTLKLIDKTVGERAIVKLKAMTSAAGIASGARAIT